MNTIEKMGLATLILFSPYFESTSGVEGLIIFSAMLLGFVLFMYGKKKDDI
jgi:hypothetical protein